MLWRAVLMLDRLNELGSYGKRRPHIADDPVAVDDAQQ
jgi:hypothetical protein